MDKRRTLKLYDPHAGQAQAHASQTRFNLLRWGRQSGKTTFGLNRIADKAWRGPQNGVYWYLLQTYDAAEVAFKRLYSFYRASPGAFDKKPNESDLMCRFRHGPEISFKSGRNFEDLRIETLDGVVIDEYRQQHPDLWPVVIRPMLAAKKGWADVLSTTNGYDHFYELHEQVKENTKEWSIFVNPSTIAPWWDAEEIASARSTMTEDYFNQEINAEFIEIGVGKVYKQHGAHNQKVENPFAIRGYDWSFYLPLIIGLDFNVSPMAWCIAQHKGGSIHVGDEIAIENTDTAQCAAVLVEKVQKFYDLMGEGPKPHVILIGDASGNARKTSAVGETDYSIIKKALRDAEIKYEDLTPKENPGVKDRVNGVNSMLKSADGSVHLTYNPKKCTFLKRDFERVKWKEGTSGAFFDTSDKLLTHMSDGLGYVVCHYNQIFRERPGRMRVITR